MSVVALGSGCTPEEIGASTDGGVQGVDQTPPSLANGIAIDEAGYLWIVDGPGFQILRLEPPGEKIVARYGCAGGDDLVVTRDAIYYTASLTGNVDRLDRRTGKVAAVGYVGLGVNPIAFSPKGRLLAGIAPGPLPILAPLFNGLFEVDPSGVREARRVVADSSSINAFCVAPDGFLYGPAPTHVVRIDVARNVKTIISDGFAYAAAVRFNPRDRRLYVLDVSPAESPNAPILYSMRLDGTDRQVFARLSDQPQAVYAGDNFAIAEDGTFYVTRFEPIITRVSADATRIEDFRIGKP